MDAIAEVRGLSKRFGHKTVLDDLRFNLLPGRIYGLVGPNGAGKTTLLGSWLVFRRKELR